MKRAVVFFMCIFAVSVTLPSHAQETGFSFTQDTPSNPLTLLFKNEATPRQFVLATGEMICDNLLVMGWNVIVKDRDWAKVNLKTMQANLTKTWVWDNNTFFMNQIGHPYHGSLYYTSARSNNLNWLESSLVTAAGSLMWEFFMETGAPSANDFITTTTAGMVLGEVLHRLSFEAYDVLPLFGWIISPVNAITSFVTGSRARRPLGYLWRNDWFIAGGISTSSFTLSDGQKKDSPLHAPLFGFGFDAIYSSPYGHNSKELFDQFRVRGDVFTAYNYRFFRLFMDGTLYSVSVADWSETDTTLGLTLNYDIFNIDDISLSAGSAGITIKQQASVKSFLCRWSADLDYIFMGVPDVYFILNGDATVTASKSVPPYTYTHGPEARLSLEINNFAFGRLSLDAQALFLMPYTGTARDTRFASNSLIAFCEAKYEHLLFQNISLGVSDLFYFKTDWNTQIPSVTQITNFARLYIKFSFR